MRYVSNMNGFELTCLLLIVTILRWLSSDTIIVGVVQIFAPVLEYLMFEHDFEHLLQKFELRPIIVFGTM